MSASKEASSAGSSAAVSTSCVSATSSGVTDSSAEGTSAAVTVLSGNELSAASADFSRAESSGNAIETGDFSSGSTSTAKTCAGNIETIMDRSKMITMFRFITLIIFEYHALSKITQNVYVLAQKL